MTTASSDLPTIAVVGTTATGKSELGLQLAERLDGEVVNADAMQLYRGMDIGTAKLSPDERRSVRHHQLDVLDVTQAASVAAYQRYSRHDIEGIRDRGHVPVLIGGSGLYVRAALDRLEIPPTDPDVRDRLTAELERHGVVALRKRLAELDPVAAAAIDPNNGRRTVRALEVIELTGEPFSATMPTRELLQPTVMIGLTAPREVLDRRIGSRVTGMWRRGLVEEVRSLLPLGLRDGATAAKALGYAQAIAQLDGHVTEHEAREATATATRRYARRQESWFRADPRIAWLEHDAPDLVERALGLVAEQAGPAARMGP